MKLRLALAISIHHISHRITCDVTGVLKTKSNQVQHKIVTMRNLNPPNFTSELLRNNCEVLCNTTKNKKLIIIIVVTTTTGIDGACSPGICPLKIEKPYV